MVYRGFTWNLTASEADAVWRLARHVQSVGAARYLEHDADRVLSLYRHWDEVRTDGTKATGYFYADS